MKYNNSLNFIKVNLSANTFLNKNVFQFFLKVSTDATSQLDLAIGPSIIIIVVRPQLPEKNALQELPASCL